MANALCFALSPAGFVSRWRKYDSGANSNVELSSPQRLHQESRRRRRSVHIFSEDRLGQIGKKRKRERSPYDINQPVSTKRHDPKADQQYSAVAERANTIRTRLLSLRPFQHAVTIATTCSMIVALSWLSLCLMLNLYSLATFQPTAFSLVNPAEQSLRVEEYYSSNSARQN